MKRHQIFTSLLLILTALPTACSPNEEEPEDKSKTYDRNYGWDTPSSEPAEDGYMTVAEAIEAPMDAFINVRGYILGSTSRSLYNSIMAPPFESRSSLILADHVFRPGDTPDEYDPFYEDDLFPVSLNDFSDTKRALNLVDNPWHWHRVIYIFGRKTRYMGVPGMDKILKYEFEDEMQ